MSTPSHRPILLIDHDDAARFAMRDALLGAGYQVIAEANGPRALSRLAASTITPQLVVLKTSAPTMSGWEFLVVMRSDHRLAAVPVIIVCSEAPHAETLQRGAVDGWLYEPVDHAKLVEGVKMHVAAY